MAKRREFSLEEIEDICNSYKSGVTRQQLYLKYHCTDKVIVRVLEENNIEIRRVKNPGKHPKRYNVNENYFNINNQSSNSAYILGVLASDGCVAKNQNQIYIELQRYDKELLEKINKEIENERPVKDYHNNSKDYDNSKLYFFSKQIKDDLSLYNIIPNKTSYNNDFLQNIDDRYYIDFIRGLFDGDGFIKWTGGSIQWQIDSTSLKTLNHIQEILKEMGVETKIVSSKSENQIINYNVYRIYCYNYKNCYKLYQLFYTKENIIYLSRKKERFKKLLLKYKSHETLDLQKG